MLLSVLEANRLLREFTDGLWGGALALLAGQPTEFSEELLRIALPGDWRIVDGVATLQLDSTAATVQRSGEVGFARLLSAADETVADLTVGLTGASDLVVSSLRLQRGGMCQLQSVSVRMPRSA